jgi:hypothetical protein
MSENNVALVFEKRATGCEASLGCFVAKYAIEAYGPSSFESPRSNRGSHLWITDKGSKRASPWSSI